MEGPRGCVTGPRQQRAVRPAQRRVQALAGHLGRQLGDLQVDTHRQVLHQPGSTSSARTSGPPRSTTEVPATGDGPHTVNFAGYSGRQKVLAIWNIADTSNAFYACVDLRFGGGGGNPPPRPRDPHSRPHATPTVTSPGGTWAPMSAYAVGAPVTYAGLSYKCLQAHTSLPGWELPNVPRLPAAPLARRVHPRRRGAGTSRTPSSCGRLAGGVAQAAGERGEEDIDDLVRLLGDVQGAVRGAGDVGRLARPRCRRR